MQQTTRHRSRVWRVEYREGHFVRLRIRLWQLQQTTLVEAELANASAGMGQPGATESECKREVKVIATVPGVCTNGSQVEGPRPLVDAAPSTWYADVAVPNTKPLGNDARLSPPSQLAPPPAAAPAPACAPPHATSSAAAHRATTISSPLPHRASNPHSVCPLAPDSW